MGPYEVAGYLDDTHAEEIREIIQIEMQKRVLFSAAFNGSIDAIVDIVNEENVDLNHLADKDGNTVFHYVAINGSLDTLLAKLFERRENIKYDEKNKDGLTASDFAVIYNNFALHHDKIKKRTSEIRANEAITRMNQKYKL